MYVELTVGISVVVEDVELAERQKSVVVGVSVGKSCLQVTCRAGNK